MDATAEWCLPCKELEVYTFSDPVVIEAAKGFVMLKADYTTGGDAEAAEIKKRLNIIGVPTLVFIGPDGDERAESRAAGFITAGEFAERLKLARE
ncbi:MAG: thioredoxin family protein [Nitrospinae bacterium]|nr:thioredoxin family protein [Nitrospinota bacterium]